MLAPLKVGLYFSSPRCLGEAVRDKEKLFRILELFVQSYDPPGAAALWKHKVMVFVGGKKYGSMNGMVSKVECQGCGLYEWLITCFS